VRMGWNDATKKALSALLYVAGVLAVLFVAYQNSVAPGSVYGYMPLYAIGMASVVAAALLWPKDGRGTLGQGNGAEGVSRRGGGDMSQDKSDAHHELEAAGWEPELREGEETLWQNPKDGRWYEEKRAIEILKGGEAAGPID
jgi:hypothetical protein